MRAFIPSALAAREIRRDSPLRRARSCYGHLAGVAGVRLFDEMVGRGWLSVGAGERPDCALTATGERELLARGVVLPGGGRRSAHGCRDWTERRLHLGGRVGAAILAALVEARVAVRSPGSRSVLLRQPLDSWLR